MENTIQEKECYICKEATEEAVRPYGAWFFHVNCLDEEDRNDWWKIERYAIMAHKNWKSCHCRARAGELAKLLISLAEQRGAEKERERLREEIREMREKEMKGYEEKIEECTRIGLSKELLHDYKVEKIAVLSVYDEVLQSFTQPKE